jgi:D-xylose 1-dehydrogenase (NADP+, D-xylono-1,5-lactone-forming)
MIADTRRKTRIGVIGLGRISTESVVPAIRRSKHAYLYAAASREMSRAQALCPERSYDDYWELLRDPLVEAVYIATHNGLHHDLALEALCNGKHVLCEKPLGVNVQECQSLLRTAEATGRVLIEAFMYRYHPQIAMVRDIVTAGTIGRLMVVESSFRFPMTKTNDVRLRREWGGGALLDVGCYCVNVSRYFLGDTPTRVSAVSSLEPEHEIDTSTQGILEYESGRFATISCGFDGGLHQRLSLVGSRGVIQLDKPFIAWGATPRLYLSIDQTEKSVTFPMIDTFQLEIDDFVAAIRDGTSPMLSPDEGLRNARILELIAAAA